MKEDFLEQIDQYMVYVYNIALKMLGEEDAKDAAQESIIKAYEKLDTFRGGCALSTWLYRITINECKDILRRRKDVISLDEIADIAATNDEFERLETRDQIHRAFAHLSPEEKELLILRDMLGFEYREIAEHASMPEGTVKSKLNRARKKMKQILSIQEER